MRSRSTVREPERAHFVTSTIVDWLPVLHTAACCDLLAGSLDYCRREKGLRLYAWVIMENHFHAVVHAADLPRVMADLKKFTVGKLLAQLAAERRTWLPDLLAAGKAAHKTRSTWQLWQEGYHPQAIYSDQTMLQKDRLHPRQPRPARLGRIPRALALQLRARVAARQPAGRPVRSVEVTRRHSPAPGSPSRPQAASRVQAASRAQAASCPQVTPLVPKVSGALWERSSTGENLSTLRRPTPSIAPPVLTRPPPKRSFAARIRSQSAALTLGTREKRERTRENEREPMGGAHQNHAAAIANLKTAVGRQLDELKALTPSSAVSSPVPPREDFSCLTPLKTLRKGEFDSAARSAWNLCFLLTSVIRA